ncbi:MAG: GNAT family N-acetyltransferase [Clostridia bacterium]|nr:GNAT family N-acetyltransferase [Clostridia bacterium]
MIAVLPLQDIRMNDFEPLFIAYYEELDCEDDAKETLDGYVMPDVLAGLIFVDLIYDEDVPCGFAIRQIDDIDNDWCWREGWGDIREMYIAPDFRRKGLGKFLLYTEEMKLREAGATKSYCLPVVESEPFFAACGYEKTDEFDSGTACYVFEKPDLSNHECGGCAK